MSIREYIPLNVELIANPYNWVVIFLMVTIAALGLHLLFTPTAAAQDGA